MLFSWWSQELQIYVENHFFKVMQLHDVFLLTFLQALWSCLMPLFNMVTVLKLIYIQVVYMILGKIIRCLVKKEVRESALVFKEKCVCVCFFSFQNRWQNKFVCKSYLRSCMDEYWGIHNFTKDSEDEHSWRVHQILTGDRDVKMNVRLEGLFWQAWITKVSAVDASLDHRASHG